MVLIKMVFMAKQDIRWQQRFSNYRKALEMNLIDDKQWMDTIEDRNLTVHNYDNEVASEIYENIMHVYFPLFVAFGQKIQSLIEPTLFD